MINKGKAVLAALGNAPRGNVQVAVPDAEATGGGFRFGVRPGYENTFVDTVAGNLSKWVNGDLSWLAGQPGDTPGSVPMKPDQGKRKRDAMADVLDGKNK